VRFPESAAQFAPELEAQQPALVADAVDSALDLKAVREWAKAQGYTVSATGRIRAEIIETYRQATAS
jgi:hypothetical protein